MDLEANLKAVQQRVEAACARAGREPGSVTLVAVTIAFALTTRDGANSCWATALKNSVVILGCSKTGLA